MPSNGYTIISWMLWYYMLTLLIVTHFGVNSQVSNSSKHELRVMSFNIWVSGTNVNNGLQKIIKHIKLINPDILALQEVSTSSILEVILRKLGKKWTGFCKNSTYPDTAIITQHQIINKSKAHAAAGNGADIYIKWLDKTINFWSMHLDWKSYGPYAAFNKLVTLKEQILTGEYGRFSDIRDLLSNEYFLNAINESSQKPVIVCGDFNSPSHLDWNNSTSHIHGDWDFEWPATKYLQMETGLQDSFRQLHPDVIKDPGITWSTVQKMSSQGWNWTIPEPQDRIDFIFYTNATIQAISSNTYSGFLPLKPIPYHKRNDYPSDHFAVVTNFVARQ